MSSDLPKEKGGLDIFKVILVACALACVAFGTLLFLEYRRLDRAKGAYEHAQNLVPEIRSLSEAIRQLHQKESTTDAMPNMHDYIEKFITRGSGMGRDDFQVKDAEGAVDKRGFQDRTVQVTFGSGGRAEKAQKALSRQNIFSMLFNLESQSPQYKISRLSIAAEELAGARGRNQEDPRELSDNWVLRDLVVVRRGPAKVEVAPRKAGGI